MKNSIIMTLPQSDDVTEYLCAFSKEIIRTAKEKNIPIITLERERAIKQIFESELRENHRMVIFNGHGSQNIIAGYKNETIIKNGENEILLKEKITYSRSCYSAKGIGNSSMKESKTGCFIGYELPFMFYNDVTWSGNPIKDPVAKIFFSTTNKIPNGIISGKSCIEAYKSSKISMLKAIKRILINETQDSHAIAEALWNNYSVQTIIGNKNVRFNNDSSFQNI